MPAGWTSGWPAQSRLQAIASNINTATGVQYLEVLGWQVVAKVFP